MRNPLRRPSILLVSAFAFAPQPASAQSPASDTAELRGALAAALGDEFTIVRDELHPGTRERGGPFWLVYARPRRSGDYRLQYRYEYRDLVRPEKPLYTHVEHESYIRVGERGCWRRHEGKDICLGDTIILPFVVQNFTGHTFALTRRDPATLERPAPEAAAGDPAVANPVSEHLRYIGSRSYEMPHRDGGGTTVRSAEFEAARPGSFNLTLAPRLASGDPVQPSDFGSVPVVVVARGEPVTVLLENETVVGRDEKHGFSSHSGNQYLTTVRLLQPGDRISLEYLRYSSPAPHRVDSTALAGLRGVASARPGGRVETDAPPVITSFPFRVDPDDRFNAWIVDHLPGSTRATR